MLAAEFGEFETELRRVAKTLPPKTELDDEMMQSYWFALKDQSLAVFKRFVAHHERYGRWFPKPFELRAKEDRTPAVEGGKEDGSFKAAEAMCIRNLEDLRKKDPEEHRREVGRRVLDRILATQHPGSSMYEAALNEWRPFRDR